MLRRKYQFNFLRKLSLAVNSGNWVPLFQSGSLQLLLAQTGIQKAKGNWVPLFHDKTFFGIKR